MNVPRQACRAEELQRSPTACLSPVSEAVDIVVIDGPDRRLVVPNDGRSSAEVRALVHHEVVAVGDAFPSLRKHRDDHSAYTITRLDAVPLPDKHWRASLLVRMIQPSKAPIGSV